MSQASPELPDTEGGVVRPTGGSEPCRHPPEPNFEMGRSIACESRGWMHFHDGPRHSVAGDGFGQEKRRRMSESRFRGLTPGSDRRRRYAGTGIFDGKAEVKAVMAVKIGETSPFLCDSTQCSGLVCDATAGQGEVWCWPCLRTEGRHERRPTEISKPRWVTGMHRRQDSMTPLR